VGVPPMEVTAAMVLLAILLAAAEFLGAVLARPFFVVGLSLGWMACFLAGPSPGPGPDSKTVRTSTMPPVLTEGWMKPAGYRNGKMKPTAKL